LRAEVTTWSRKTGEVQSCVSAATAIDRVVHVKKKKKSSERTTIDLVRKKKKKKKKVQRTKTKIVMKQAKKNKQKRKKNSLH